MNSAVSEHDIIDNSQALLAERVDEFLDMADAGRFAIGYLFLAGLAPFVHKLVKLNELRLLIGNTSNRETLEQLAEGHRQLELIQESAEALQYPKRPAVRRMELEAADNVRSTISLMDQTEETEEAVQTLIRMIENGRLKVRVHTKGRLQARAYIFDFPFSLSSDGASASQNTGAGIVGSSNLTLAAVSRNAELNVVARGNQNHAELVRWFDSLWDDARNFDERLMRELKQSWAAMRVSPYDVYMKSLFTLIRDRLEDDDASTVLWDDDITRQLADFQRVAVEHAVQIIRSYGGVFVSDVVGLGKSFVGAAIVKHFERTHRCRPLIVCPASLVDMWERYNEVYQLNARVLSMGKLREDQDAESTFLVDDELYQSRDFVLIDESHNFRHSNTQRYRLLEEFLGDGKRCCLLTATPRNKSAWDVYTQLKLFHQNDRTDIPVNPPNLQEFFKGVERGTHRLHELLANILIRRTRRDILKWYGYDGETHERIDPERFDEYRNGGRRAYVIVAGRHQFFPKRELETIEYNIDEAYQGLYQDIRHILGSAGGSRHATAEPDELTYARYGLWHYVLPARKDDDRYAGLQRAGVNLRGLMRVLLFKRFESSVHAFRETVGRLLTSHNRFRQALEEGIVPAGEEAQDLLNDPDDSEEQELLDNLREVSGRYSATDFDLTRLIEHIEHDIGLLQRILDFVAPITPERDAKLQTLLQRICTSKFESGKCLIFTQYADTARYLHENLVSATDRDDIDVVCSNDKNRVRAVARFAPLANPEYRRRSSDTELNILVATDALSEGLNLQDGNRIVNYDLHWNPVRLIQRFGRIDRIGSEHDSVYGFNFLPETGIEQQLGLRRVLASRIQEIHETIGEDAAILDPSEQLNENAMYAIYEQRGGLPESIDDEDDTSFDLNEATEMFRQLRKDDPAEYDRIATLPDGIRSAMMSAAHELFVHCQAGRFQQLYLVDSAGKVLSQDLPVVLSKIRCMPEIESAPLPKGHNEAVMRIKRIFAEEVKQRQAERYHTVSLGHGQRYVIRELRQLSSATDDEDKKARINILEQALRRALPTAVVRDLNRLRRNSVTGDNLYASVVDLYNHHGLRDRVQNGTQADEPLHVPKLVCSEALLGQR
jgi:superfamily II DNA or RNA helicase